MTTFQYNPEFNLYRSTTSGGPYTLLLSTNTNNAYDFTAVPGTTYYYVVTATNYSGESAYSGQTECSATTAGSSGYGSGSNNVPQYPSGFPK